MTSSSEALSVLYEPPSLPPRLQEAAVGCHELEEHGRDKLRWVNHLSTLGG